MVYVYFSCIIRHTFYCHRHIIIERVLLFIVEVYYLFCGYPVHAAFVYTIVYYEENFNVTMKSPSNVYKIMCNIYSVLVM